LRPARNAEKTRARYQGKKRTRDEMGENLKQGILGMIVSRPLNPREFVILAAVIGLLLRIVLS
jgi:hypothetical protein